MLLTPPRALVVIVVAMGTLMGGVAPLARAQRPTAQRTTLTSRMRSRATRRSTACVTGRGVGIWWGVTGQGVWESGSTSHASVSPANPSRGSGSAPPAEPVMRGDEQPSSGEWKGRFINPLRDMPRNQA